MLSLETMKNRSKFYDQQYENRLPVDCKTEDARQDAKNFQDDCVTSSVQGPLPQVGRVLRRIRSSLWSRLWGASNPCPAPAPAPAPAHLKTHPNEPSILYPARMHSKPIPQWQVSPAAYVGYRYRLR
ncbi:uncharacterized protein LOC6540917 [Drosophila erecta]|uniref:Uncharacterized protein n=1 Tax=Drosophila erecta TaxID=7220 RepID=B3N8G3_DROER|nr:uncharacterized protein LOC6540917 [Drosophila erecta]EDV58386.1 uncharacterized protein Dere_GG24017 [Drosophila erecta]